MRHLRQATNEWAGENKQRETKFKRTACRFCNNVQEVSLWHWNSFAAELAEQQGSASFERCGGRIVEEVEEWMAEIHKQPRAYSVAAHTTHLCICIFKGLDNAVIGADVKALAGRRKM
jgi:hypothetical protein